MFEWLSFEIVFVNHSFGTLLFFFFENGTLLFLEILLNFVLMEYPSKDAKTLLWKHIARPSFSFFGKKEITKEYLWIKNTSFEEFFDLVVQVIRLFKENH